MRSKQYFTSIKNNPHEISTDPQEVEWTTGRFHAFLCAIN